MTQVTVRGVGAGESVRAKLWPDGFGSLSSNADQPIRQGASGMPTYDYQCEKCGVAFEVFQSFSEDSLKKCPTKKSGNSPEGCQGPGKGKVNKVFSPPGITFKGSGFYKTDSRSGSKAPSATSPSSSDTASSGDDKKSNKSTNDTSTSTTSSSSSSSDKKPSSTTDSD